MTENSVIIVRNGGFGRSGARVAKEYYHFRKDNI